MISDTAVIMPGVRLGKNTIVEDYCVIGVGSTSEACIETTIGDNSHIRSHTVIYAGNTIGSGFATGNKANIRENNTIGDDVSVGTLTVIEHSVEIGDSVRIHSQAFIPEFSVLETGCWIGPNVVLTNAKYPNTPDAKLNLEGPVVRHRGRVGANATLLPGVVVGRGSIVGAGAVVTKSVADGWIVAGNPATKIGEAERGES